MLSWCLLQGMWMPLYLGFTSKLMPLSYLLALKEANMVDIEKILPFFNRLWKFLVDPFGLAFKAVHADEPLKLPPAFWFNLGAFEHATQMILRCANCQ